MISVLLERIHSLSEQLARLSANVSVLEQRIRLTSQTEKRESTLRMQQMQREMADLKKKIGTHPISLKQVTETWWLRLLAIGLLGAANIDLKHAIELVLQLK